ncbi:conjugative transposon protein TraN [Flavobacterium sp. MK4S-17]|uniref:conjugative transposon protein TraN n=1 Tax=Flavobacterium sp. MK4S-17 TaxID=2543737 RepID=UPI001358F2D1|nr:conjugative transposon protein TraN [Flavobacterium sp. MK4S-17]
MKIRTIIKILLLALPWPVLSQSAGTALPVTRSIDITDQQTTSLLFPYPIASVDRGSQDILAQKPKGVENVLQIKAAQEQFMQSNLTVVTTDGKLYNFQVCYTNEPAALAYDFSNGDKQAVVSLTDFEKADSINALASAAYHDRNRISLKESDYGITLSITGMFVADDYFFYRITIANDSNISYDIDQLRFFVKDQKRSRRTASQEVEIAPLTYWMHIEKVPAKGIKTFVAVLPKFTIPNKKNLHLQLTEKSGGRHLQMKVRNSKRDDVVPLPTFSK